MVLVGNYTDNYKLFSLRENVVYFKGEIYMAQYVKKIRTDAGDLQIDYNALANLPNLDEKANAKIYYETDLNTILEPGLYYVHYDSESSLNYPSGKNGNLLVMEGNGYIRQVFFRGGMPDTNDIQWFTRSKHAVTDYGLNADGWGQWWMLSGLENVWSGRAAKDTEICLGSRFGCQAWIIGGQPTSGSGGFSTIYVPRNFVTDTEGDYTLRLADETGYINFRIYYKTSDNNVYAKISAATDATNGLLRYAYRVS